MFNDKKLIQRKWKYVFVKINWQSNPINYDLKKFVGT